MAASRCELCGMDGFKHFHGHAEANKYDHLSPKPDCPNYRQLTGDRNQCPNCGEYFNSSSAFTFHRKGFRCLSTVEMQAKGMVQILDVKGKNWWVQKLKEPQITSTQRAGGAEIDSA